MMGMDPDAAWQEMVRECLSRPAVGDGPRAHRAVPGWLLEFTSAPLVSARVCAWRNALREWEWLMYGEGRLDALHPSTRHWWARWASERGVVPGVCVGTLEALVLNVSLRPESRRNVVTTLSLGPCPVPRNDFVAQFHLWDGALELFVFQRTCDLGRGAPHNWLQFWALGAWVAHRASLPLARLRWISGDAHLYVAHEPVLRRAAAVLRGLLPERPALRYAPTGTAFRASDFSLDGPYSPVVRDTLGYV